MLQHKIVKPSYLTRHSPSSKLRLLLECQKNNVELCNHVLLNKIDGDHLVGWALEVCNQISYLQWLLWLKFIMSLRIAELQFWMFDIAKSLSTYKFLWTLIGRHAICGWNKVKLLCSLRGKNLCECCTDFLIMQLLSWASETCSFSSQILINVDCPIPEIF